MVPAMIINRRRIEGVTIKKRRGTSVYIMEVQDHEGPHGRWAAPVQCIHPFWANITTEDLNENWNARFFQQIVPAKTAIVTEHRLPASSDYWRTVSWVRTPVAWTELFTLGLREHFPHLAFKARFLDVDPDLAGQGVLTL
jgi:hypothetical protein